MSRDQEYYRIAISNDDAIPLLDPDTDCPIYLSKREPIENPELLLFQLGSPIPRKPKIVDYHSSPNSVISKKIFDVLFPLNIEGIQLLPAIIRGKNDEIFADYWAIHIYNRIQCIDPALSDCEIKSIRLSRVKKLVLDKNLLGTIPINKRLVFRLKEDTSYQLFHVSIVEAIMAVNPEGLRFVNIEQWNDGSFFSN
jgi:hypothetical protein